MPILESLRIQTVDEATHQELWIPAEELESFNQNIVGPIEMIAQFGT